MIPGLAVGRCPAAPRPLALLTPGTLLFDGPSDPVGHRLRWGPVPELDLISLIGATSHLVGAGGAEFPTARKLTALAGGPVAAVVINAMEGEPASAKDHLLMMAAPHLVLDGAAAVARALGAGTVVIRTAGSLAAAARAAAGGRADALRWTVSVGPESFVAGEASAIARALRGGPALPDGAGRPPMIGRLRRRPVFLSNAETFARIALAVRGEWRDSALVTVSGAVERPGVAELPAGSTVGDLLTLAGARDPAVLVTGGWHGAWLPWQDRLGDVPLRRDAVREAGGRWGAGAMIVLGHRPHPALVLRAVADKMAAASAGQCGPCVNGLPELARAIAAGRDPAPLAGLVAGRGFCSHPTAAAAALLSGAAAVAAYQRSAVR